jgi:hypothetical protein
MNAGLTLLKSEYGIVSNFIVLVPGGFSTKAAYRVAVRTVPNTS